MKKRILIFSISVLFVIYSCKPNGNVPADKCSATNKIDSLIQRITEIPDIYRSIPEEKKGYRFLVSHALTPTRDFYKGYFDTLYTVNRNVAMDAKVGTLFIDTAKFNIDSNIVNVIASYYILAQYRVTTMHATFEFDTNSCNWKQTKISIDVH